MLYEEDASNSLYQELALELVLKIGQGCICTNSSVFFPVAPRTQGDSKHTE